MSRCPAILASALGAAALLQAQASAIDPVLRAELAFARMAGDKGIRPAFLAWLTEDARVFTPRMTTSKARYGPGPGDGGHLDWYPEAMGIAASGELAWSFGPWSYAGKKGEAPRAHGHFLSIWRRLDGRWRVVADIGVPHAAPERPIEPFAAWDGPPPRRWRASKAQDPGPALRNLEAALAEGWSLQGGVALLPHLANEARILRPGVPPSAGEGAIRQTLAADSAGPRWEPAILEVAASGDLAWTCGETGPGEGAASYLRIWSFESGVWRVRFDVRLPHPAGPK